MTSARDGLAWKLAVALAGLTACTRAPTAATGPVLAGRYTLRIAPGAGCAFVGSPPRVEVSVEAAWYESNFLVTLPGGNQAVTLTGVNHDGAFVGTSTGTGIADGSGVVSWTGSTRGTLRVGADGRFEITDGLMRGALSIERDVQSSGRCSVEPDRVPDPNDGAAHHWSLLAT